MLLLKSKIKWLVVENSVELSNFMLSHSYFHFSNGKFSGKKLKKCLDLFFDLQKEKSRKLIDLKLIVHFKREISLVKIYHYITQMKMLQIDWIVIKSVQYRNQTISSRFTLFQESSTIRLELSIWLQFFSS